MSTWCTREVFISGLSMYCGGRGTPSSGWDEMGLTWGIEFEQPLVIPWCQHFFFSIDSDNNIYSYSNNNRRLCSLLALHIHIVHRPASTKLPPYSSFMNGSCFSEKIFCAFDQNYFLRQWKEEYICVSMGHRWAVRGLT